MSRRNLSAVSCVTMAIWTRVLDAKVQTASANCRIPGSPVPTDTKHPTRFATSILTRYHMPLASAQTSFAGFFAPNTPSANCCSAILVSWKEVVAAEVARAVSHTIEAAVTLSRKKEDNLYLGGLRH